MMNRFRLALLPLCTLALAVACGGGDGGGPAGPPPVATVAVTAASGNIVVGQTAQLIATPKDANGNTVSGKTVTWSTSNASIATVNTSGTVTGVTPGSATITATADGKSGTQTVTVVAPPVASVTVTATVAFLKLGETTTLTAVVRDGNGNVVAAPTIAWTTSDAAVATVSSSGVVTGVATGVVTITATVGTVAGSVQLTVDPPEISGVSPNPLVEGQPATITGVKFATTAAGNIVRVAGVPATVTSASGTSIEIVVPKVCRPATTIDVDVTARGARSAPRATPFRPTGTFSLAVGQQQVITNPADFCLQFSSTAATEKYVIGVQSIVENVTNVTSANVTMDAGPANIVTSGLTRSRALASRVAIAAGPVFSSAITDRPIDPRAERFARHREVESALIGRDREVLQARIRAVHSAGRTQRASFSNIPTVTGNAKVGDVLNIRVPNRNTTSTCQNFIPLAVTVKMIGQRGIFVEDNANPTGGFSTANYQALSDQFDAQIYATDVSYFGTPPDGDSNSRIVIVITKEVNKITNLLGQVFTADLVPTSICPSSNEGEFFYGRAPDPSGAAGTAYTIADALLDAPVIIAHEFTHIIQLGRRIENPLADFIQSTWELEGQATFAEEVNGYTATGLAPGQNLGFEIAFNTPATQPISWFIDPFVDLAVYYGFASATSRIAGAPEQCSWLATRSQGNSGPCLTGREPYGVPWSFFRWLSDHYGPQFPDGEKGLHRALIDDTVTGFATIGRVIGTQMEPLLAQWAAMLYVDDRFPGTDPKLSLKSWNLVAIEQRLNVNARLTPRDRQFVSFNDQISVRGGSSAYYVLSGAGRPATALRVRDIGDAMLPAGVQLWIVRVQ